MAQDLIGRFAIPVNQATIAGKPDVGIKRAVTISREAWYIKTCASRVNVNRLLQ